MLIASMRSNSSGGVVKGWVLWIGGRSFNPASPMGLKSVLVLVTDRSGYSSLPAGFTHIPECLCQSRTLNLYRAALSLASFVSLLYIDSIRSLINDKRAT